MYISTWYVYPNATLVQNSAIYYTTKDNLVIIVMYSMYLSGLGHSIQIYTNPMVIYPERQGFMTVMSTNFGG